MKELVWKIVKNYFNKWLFRTFFSRSTHYTHFKFLWISILYNNFILKADSGDLDHGTECLLLALKHTGTQARMVQGPEYLWKVEL